MNILGLDIGGANLKAADADGHALSIPFPMWSNYQKLHEVLRDLILKWPEQFDTPAVTRIALTMTGELADCFATKAEGVSFILSQVEEASGHDIEVSVWQTSGEFVDMETAREFWTLTAAANWHGLATWAAKSVPTSHGLLIDIGSTTTDIIPLSFGFTSSQGLTDLERMASGELVYFGVQRTPVAAICSHVPSSFVIPEATGEMRMSSEQFATMGDVYVLTGDLPEDRDNTQTADHRPLTVPYAQNRLAHQFCGDVTELSPVLIRNLAQFLKWEQLQELCDKIEDVCQKFTASLERESTEIKIETIILSGEGEFLAKEAISRLDFLSSATILSLSQMMNPASCNAACAFALARLASESL
jgi:hypothetical protein